MKKINLLLFFAVMISQAYSQVNNYDLPQEFKDLAIQAFQKVSPATKQWFVDAAKRHPAGPFDSAWARKKLSEKFLFTDMNSSGGLFMVMIEYQRMLNKEVREDRKITTQDKKTAMASKDNKLNLQDEKIEQGKKEADEKASKLMNAATNNLWLGIISGALQIAGGNVTSNSTNSNLKANQIKSSSNITPVVTLQKIDSPKTKTKNADLMQKEINKQEEQAAKDDEEKKANEDHKKALRDAIQKLLDELRNMKPNLDP